ncbi:phage terminase small subunit P27 family [Nonomuraea sp. NPDC051941]|uniref:phage terminase small subunit P27 family n=1 Tax=Nonomuraea sp. NPDC051941 TaxID=3364373 RepID=UPI0037C6177E
MTRPGPKPKPYLQAVREGNPGHKRLTPGMVLPASEPVEPDWADLFPGERVDELQARRDAAEVWSRTAPMLARCAGLTSVQQDSLIDFCVTTARIRQCNRALSLEGLIIDGDRGRVRNPLCTVVSQLRQHWRSLMGELGLSPSAATRLTVPEDEDDDDPFD